MQNLIARRIAGIAFPFAIATGFAVLSAAPASAHEGPEPVGNAGDAVDYATEEAQHGHIDQPLVGLSPAVADPSGYVAGHVVPFTLNVVSIATTGHATDGTTDPVPDHGH